MFQMTKNKHILSIMLVFPWTYCHAQAQEVIEWIGNGQDSFLPNPRVASWHNEFAWSPNLDDRVPNELDTAYFHEEELDFYGLPQTVFFGTYWDDHLTFPALNNPAATPPPANHLEWPHDYAQSRNVQVASGGFWTFLFDLQLPAGFSGPVTSGGLFIEQALTVGSNDRTASLQIFGLGALEIDGAPYSVRAEAINIGTSASSAGNLMLDDEASVYVEKTATGDGRVIIGDSGTGLLSINGGATLKNNFSHIGSQTGSSGSATVSGSDSLWHHANALIIGEAGNGTLLVEAGGRVNNSFTHIGGTTSGVGEATITGENSSWVLSDALVVGNAGMGTLLVEDGALLTNSSFSHLGSFETGVGHVTVTGANSTWSIGDALEVGFNGSGVLSIVNGGRVDTGSFVRVGLSNTSAGEVNIVGTGSTWSIGDTLEIGVGGNGTLSIQEKGVVSNSFGILGWNENVSGTVTVDGADSEWNNSETLLVGRSGIGSLEITNGGRVTNSRNPSFFTSAAVGTFSGSDGTVVVDGAGSEWITTGGGGISIGAEGTGTVTVRNAGVLINSDFMTIGASSTGNGTLLIQSGGTVTNGGSDDTTVDIGERAGAMGAAKVEGASSVWNNVGTLLVGRDGTGSLTIADGGRVTNGRTPGFFTSSGVGTFDDSVGSVLVDGIGSEWHTTGGGGLSIGGEGFGTVIVRNQASLTNTDNMTIGASPSGVGSLAVRSGGTVTNGDLLFVGRDGDGTLEIAGGGTVESRFAWIGTFGSASGSVSVSGKNSFWNSSSSVIVGADGEATLTIVNEGMVAVGGGLTIDFDGNSDGFVNMATGGMLAIDGDGDGSIAEFLDLVAGTDAIRFWDSTHSQWSSILTGVNGVDYTLQEITSGELAGYTLLTVGEFELTGDYDGNGVVDGSDFLLWQRQVGRAEGEPFGPGDGNGDGRVTSADLSVWESQYGMTLADLATPSASKTVPEPTTFALLVFYSALALQRFRKDEI